MNALEHTMLGIDRILNPRQHERARGHVSGESLRSSVAVLEADTSGESCHESSPTMEESVARRGVDVSVCTRLAPVTGSESSKGPQQPMPGHPALVERPSPCADLGTAEVSNLYPVTCEARYYDAASSLLESEPGLFTHDNANELGALIEAWIHRARNNWEPK